MITPAYCRLMAQYNRWMNERLYALCAAMSDPERKQDRDAFFGSIHGTLNHLLWGDRMWLGRFVGQPCTSPPYGADMFAVFEELAPERRATDRDLMQWAEGVSQAWLAAPLSYTSVVDGEARRLPGSVAAIHLFNHGTHHRGQLTTLMKQAGVDPGVTDLPWLPGIATMQD
ncbi:MAG TPA: DinB family protein [Casimicrobiaceae bacterium]|nr:DinB family protein [Casimicrobiaceae bacterium]